MSIVDKLPEAPEGYVWTTRIAVYSHSTEVWVKLDRDYGGKGVPPRVPESLGILSEFCPPDEDSVIAAAQRILTAFNKSAQEHEYLVAKRDEASKVYADLLTD